MAVTDLTGTKWRFNTSIGEYAEDVYPDEQPLADMLVYTSVKDSQATYWADINFTSNGQNFVAIGGAESVPLEGGEYTEVYSGAEWIEQAYRIIEITGGTDATNPALIDYIQFNAEQIIDSPVLPSFSDVEVTPHEGYITMTINGVDFNLKTAASGYTVNVSNTGGGTFTLYDGQNTTGTLLQVMDRGSTFTATCTRGYLYAHLPSGVVANYIGKGGVSNGVNPAVVTGDGIWMVSLSASGGVED